MNKYYLWPGIVLAVIIIGFIIGLSVPGIHMKTLMGCPCTGVEGERPCNNVIETDFIFITGVVNIAKECKGSEIIVCSNGTQIGMYHNISECTTKTFFFWFS